MLTTVVEGGITKEQSPYLEEVARLLSLLSPEKLNKAISYLNELKEQEKTYDKNI